MMRNTKRKLRTKTELVAELRLVDFVLDLFKKAEVHLELQDTMGLLGYKRGLMFALGVMPNWAKEMEHVASHNRFVALGLKSIQETRRFQAAINQKEKDDLVKFIQHPYREN